MRPTRLLSVLLTAAAVALTAVALTAGALTTTATAVDAPAGAGARRATPFEVTVEPSTTEVVLGKKVTFTGKVSPRAGGETVVLQQKLAGKGWKQTGTATLSRRGRFTVSDKPSTLNQRKYRVVKAASGSHARGTSPSATVGVFRWKYLHRVDLREYRAMRKIASVTIDAVDFPMSFIGRYYYADDKTGYVDFNLARRCIRLESTLGMSDKADTGSSVKIDVVGDGSQLYTGTFGLFESDRAALDLHGVFRLALQYTVLTDALAAPAVASPRVLCSF